MTRTLRVREGNTGILCLTDLSGHREQYIPNCDLEPTRQLLLDFQNLRDSKGRFLTDNYRAGGDNWFPAMVSYLYWHVFFEYVKYKPLIDQYIDGLLAFRFENSGSLSHLIALIEGRTAGNRLKRAIFESLVAFNNWRVLRAFPVTLLFFRFSLSDFRSVEIRRTLDDLGVQYIQVVPPGRIIDLLRHLAQRRPYYYYGAVSAPNRFRHKYDVSALDLHTQQLFTCAIRHLECVLTGYMRESRIHYRRLTGTRIKMLYGFDDCNGYIFPLLYACHRAGIKTVGHQHGAYVRRHAGYVMEGIDQHDYRWFDKVIVWGEYWKDHLLRISSVYTPDMLVVGSSKLPMSYERHGDTACRRKNILLPYEFTANTYRIGRYIKRWLELGYNVYFKVRSDEPTKEQLEAYCLPPECLRKMRIVASVDSAFMAQIDIVAGTMTTLLYELLPYQKPVWVLDTEYKHLEDLVEEGFAHKVRYEDLERLDDMYFMSREVDTAYLFARETLKQTLLKNVVGEIEPTAPGRRKPVGGDGRPPGPPGHQWAEGERTAGGAG